MRTVIVVDDEPITRLDICQILIEQGFKVLDQAGDGFDAVELCRLHRPDIVLMDVRMPIFDGISATRIIIDEDLAGCVVLLTAFSDRELIEQASEVGAGGYLIKPLDQSLVLPTIEVAYAQSLKLRNTRKQSDEAQQKLLELKLIERAKGILAKQKQISELDAYNELRKVSMAKRCSIVSLANIIVDQYQNSDIRKRKKAKLLNIWAIDEKAADEKIRKYAKLNNITFDIALDQLYQQQEARR